MQDTHTITIRGEAHELNVWVGSTPETLPDLSGEEYMDSADDAWANAHWDVYRWTLTDGRYLYVFATQGEIESVTICDDDIEAYLTTCEWYDHAECVEEWVASWGVKPTLDEAPADWDGPCRVWHQPHYYAGHANPPVAGYARDDDAIREFADRAAAEAYVEEYYTAPSCYDGIPACNVLSHGQAGADTLTIVAVSV